MEKDRQISLRPPSGLIKLHSEYFKIDPLGFLPEE